MSIQLCYVLSQKELEKASESGEQEELLLLVGTNKTTKCCKVYPWQLGIGNPNTVSMSSLPLRLFYNLLIFSSHLVPVFCSQSPLGTLAGVAVAERSQRGTVRCGQGS